MRESEDNLSPATPQDTQHTDRPTPQTNTTDTTESNYWSFRAIFGGGFLKAAWIQKELKFICFICLLVVLYIANRYSVQNEILQIQNMKDSLRTIKYDALSSSSVLLERTRQSRILEFFKTTKDSTLQPNATPPFIIPDTPQED